MTSIDKPNPTNIYNDARTSVVGSPLSNTKIKLKDLEEFNFLSSNDPPQGEICIKGPSVIEKYFKNEDADGKNLIDGWFHTGDIGEI
jgi:long-chain acyl-CoA synthetase